MSLDRDAFAWWDERVNRAGSGVPGLHGVTSLGGKGGRWVAEKGVYEIGVAASSTDVRLKGAAEVMGGPLTRGTQLFTVVFTSQISRKVNTRIGDTFVL